MSAETKKEPQPLDPIVTKYHNEFTTALSEAVQRKAGVIKVPGRLIHIGQDNNNFITGEQEGSILRVTRGETVGEGDARVYSWTQVHVNLEKGGSVAYASGKFATETWDEKETKETADGAKTIVKKVKGQRHTSTSGGVRHGQDAMSLGRKLLEDLKSRKPLPDRQQPAEDVDQLGKHHHIEGIASVAAHIIHPEKHEDGKSNKAPLADRIAARKARRKQKAEASGEDTPTEQNN